jgi:hypothetical protein
MQLPGGDTTYNTPYVAMPQEKQPPSKKAAFLKAGLVDWRFSLSCHF